MHSGPLQRHHSMPVASPFFSQGSCSSSGLGFDPSLSLELGLDEPVLDTVDSLSFDGTFDFHTTKEPPIGLQLRKSESFLDLINEHLKQADSAMVS